MDGHLGRQVIFYWGGVQILGIREKGVTINGEAVDVTSDENDGWRKLLSVAGQNQVDIAISGITKDALLKNDWFAGNRTKPVAIEYPDGNAITGTFFMSNFVDTGPYNDTMTFNATLLSTGEVTWAAYS